MIYECSVRIASISIHIVDKILTDGSGDMFQRLDSRFKKPYVSLQTKQNSFYFHADNGEHYNIYIYICI